MFDWEALPQGKAGSAGRADAGERRPGVPGDVAAAEVADTAPQHPEPADGADRASWTVVHSVAINIRAGKSLQSKVLGTKQPGARVRGEPDDDWLRLLDEPGFIRMKADFCPFVVPTAACEGGDFAWVGAADVFDQLEKELTAARKGSPEEEAPAAPQRRPPALELPLGRAASAAAAAETTGGEEEPHMTVNLAEGTQDGGEEPISEAVTDWLGRARLWLQRLDPKATVPQTARLPRSAVNWEPGAAVLFVLTHGQFDPRRDVPWLNEAVAGRLATRDPNLVSVCCATSDRRRTFHPLIYDNFRRQTYEPRELVVVHTGELPSDFFREKAQSDPRVVYRFFPVTREAPGSPRLTDEKMGSPWDAVLVDDDPAELTYWEQGDPWTWEIRREGWTKGLKRNVACCIARGAVLAHFDDGCLYAPAYLSRLLAELRGGNAGAAALSTPMGGALSKWYTVGVAELEFRLVDMKKPEPMWELYGQNPRTAQEKDQYNHGFNYMYTRAAWEVQPFPDVETVGTKDSDFMKALRAQGFSVRLLEPGTQEALAACGWHRDATCGAKDAPANINDAQVLDFLRFRGDEVRTPQLFGDALRLVKEVASDLLARRERYLQDLVEEHGSVHVCAYCNFAVALSRNVKQQGRQISTSMQATDGYDMTRTYAKHPMKFEVFEVSKAGGAVAEGHWAPTPGGHSWLATVNQRMALCRNCGFQLGWRLEPQGLPKECASPCCVYQARTTRDNCCSYCRTHGPHQHDADCEKKETPAPQGPVFWGLIHRHLRERRRPGEHVPEDSDRSRHRETDRNFRKGSVCPEGHVLRCFCTGQGNGGALPFYYICDICDRPARVAEHLWGCGTCDYDMCERCRARRG